MKKAITDIIQPARIHLLARLYYWQIRVWILEQIAGTVFKIYCWKHGIPQDIDINMEKFIKITEIYRGQEITIECPICKRRQKVDRVCYELGKQGIGHGYTCGGDTCPSHTYMEMIKS